MIKTKSILEVKIGERIYNFECYPDSPLGECFDALSQMRGYVLNKMVESNQVIKTDAPPEEKQV